jgi:hypothetical protein
MYANNESTGQGQAIQGKWIRISIQAGGKKWKIS